MNWFNNPNNRFLSLLIGGGFLSCLVRALYDDAIIGATWATVICFFCLLGYFFAAKRDAAWRHNTDNVYYLGLLFTLLSLVYSLVTLFLLNSEETTDRAGQTYNLIGSFGIALISTIFGILFRILLLQSADDESGQLRPSLPVDIGPGKQRVSVALADAAFKLRIELTQTIADMSVFRQAVMQASNETVLESNRAREAIIRQIEEAGHEQTRILSTLSDTAVGKFNSSVEQIRNSLDEMADQQLKRAQHSVDFATQSIEKLEHTIQESLTKIANSGEKIQAAFSSAPESLQNIVNDLQSTIRNMEEAAGKQTKIFSTLSATAVDKFNASIEHVQNSLDEMANQQLKRVQHSVALATQSIEKLEQSVQESLAKIADSGEKIEAGFSSAPESLQSIVSGLQSTTQNIETLVTQFIPLHSTLQQTMTLLVETTREIEKTTVTLTETTGEFCQTLRQETGQWQSMTREVRSSLILAVEKLTQAVRAS